MPEKENIFLEASKNLEQQLEEHEALLKKRQPVSEQQLTYLLQLALDLDDDESATRAYLLLSSYHLKVTFDHLRSLDFAKLGLQQSEDLPDFFWRIKALNAAATSYHMLRDYPNELNQLQQALRLLETPVCNSIEYYPLHYASNYALGLVYSQLGLHTLSDPYIQKALRYSQSMNDRLILFATTLTAANLELYKRDYQKALDLYMKLYEEYADLGDNEQWAVLNNYIGIAHHFLGRDDVAEPYIRESVRVRELLGDELRMNYSYFTLAKLLYRAGRIEEGDKYFEIIERGMKKFAHMYDKQMRNDIYYELYGARGDYKKSYEHFKELDISFVANDVLERTIGGIFEAEQLKNKNMQEDSEYFRRMNDEMRSRAAELQNLNKDLKNYARTASHDLREPLRMVSAYMSILETKLKDKLTEEEKQLLHFAVDGSKRMDEMITRILNTAKGSQVILKPVDLNKTVAQLKMNLTRLIAEKKAVVEAEELPVLMADDIQMLQVFQNLVTNAIKYNQSEVPQIKITATMKGNMVEIAVADNGVGIPESERQRAFEMFQRVENASGAEGTGIGLSTVKGIIEKLKGKIWIEGNTPNGSIFKILLPTARL